ncbi:MAG: hypothetical protein AAF547_07510 [Actinomycetota bacterium]
MIGRRGVAALAVPALALVAVACGSEPAVTIAADVDPVAELPAELQIADRDAQNQSVSDDDAGQEPAQIDDVETGVTDEPVPANQWAIEVLGTPMVGDGELVRLTEPGPADDEAECSLGWLGLRREDGSIHRYDDLGRVGHLRLHNGPRGQDALVATCEEMVEAVWIQGSAVPPDDGIPRFVEFELGQPHLFDLGAELGWWGDLFGGYGWHDGWDELVLFDTATGAATEARSLLGTRLERLDHGYDVVVPDGWEIRSGDPATGRLELASADDLAWITVEPIEWAGDPEIPSTVELITYVEEQVPLWTYVGPERARRDGTQPRPTWILDTGDGTRTVHHLEGGEIDLIIDVYVAEATAWHAPVAQAVVDQLRSYRQPAVG